MRLVRQQIKRRLLFATGTIIAILSPFLIGIIPDFFWFLYLIFIPLVIYLFLKRQFLNQRVINLFTLTVSLCLTLTLVDLVLRPLINNILYFRPEDMFTNRFPQIPLLSRYEKNVYYEGQTLGDLSAMLGVDDFADRRKVIFITDEFGFRNNPSMVDNSIDLILLGDSFGAGTGTSQDKIWSNLLSEKYGLNVYNLSLPGGPWHELINLKLELPRLKTHRGTIILWAVFPGNDLDDYYSEEVNPPNSNNIVESFLVMTDSFRKRSPIGQLFHNLYANNFEGSYKKTKSKNVIVKDFINKRKILFLSKYLKTKDLTKEEIRNHQNYPKLEKVFAEMKRIHDNKSLNIFVVIVPSKEEVYSWVVEEDKPWTTEDKAGAFSEIIRELSQTYKFTFLDLKPFFVDKSKQVFDMDGSLLWWYDDTHWNEKGHELAASIVYQYLPENNLKSFMINK